MPQTEELTVSDSNRTTTTTATGNTLKPVSDDPSYKGLYVVTTYDDFFKQKNNGNGNGTEKANEAGSHG